MEKEKEIYTHIFNNWEQLPDLSHLLKIKNSYINAAKGDIIYVSYIIDNNVVVGFGSCGYYKDTNYYGKDKTKQLWIEGLVSISKRCGSIILNELEKVLINLATEFNVKHKIINVISVDESVGFYENNIYVECHTSSRFRGTGNTRMAKSIENYSLDTADIITYCNFTAELIYEYILCGRKKNLQKYINIPTTIPHLKLSEYVLENYGKCIFKDYVSESVIEELLQLLKEGW